MGKQLGKANARGLYRVEKGGVTFWIGTEEREAERRKEAIEALWKSIGESWDDVSFEVGKAIARGDKTLTLAIPAVAEGQPDVATVLLRVAQSKYPWVTLAYAGHTPVAAADFSDAAKMIDTVANEMVAERRTLFQAFDAYAEAFKQKYVSPVDNLPTEYALGEGRHLDFVKKVFADMPLAKFDMAAIDRLRTVMAKRPFSAKKKPISIDTVRRLVKVLNRFIRWLHKSPDFKWRKPVDYEVERLSVAETPDEIQDRYNPLNNPIFSDEAIGILFRYATPMERILILLGLNCGFKQSETLGLRVDEYDTAVALLSRVRVKTKVYGQWRLWPITVKALRWTEARRPNPNNQTLIQTRKGEALGHRTKSGNRGAKIANIWRQLEKRIKKDNPTFVMYPYSTLRDTGSSAIRAIAGGEVAEMYLSHGSPIPNGYLLERYANKPWPKLHEALETWWKQIGEQFQVDDAFPDDYKPCRPNSISVATANQIKALRKQGYRVSRIAEMLNVPYHTCLYHARNG